MRRMNYTILCIFYICSLTLTGCTVGPNYQSPKTSVPSSWTGINGQKTGIVDMVHWWTEFNDPNLTSLIERAVKSNLNLKQTYFEPNNLRRPMRRLYTQ